MAHEEIATTADGARIWYTWTGTGPPAVLCHGGPGLWDYLGPFAALVEDRVSVLRYDQRGAGRSDAVGPFTVDRSVADLEELRSQFGPERWIVGGHSWGASLALSYALEHRERTRGVVYVSGVGIGQDWNAAFHAEADRRRTPQQQRRLEALRALAARDPAEEAEYRVLSWAPDFADRARATKLAAALAPEPYAINREANTSIAGEMRTWDEHRDASLGCRVSTCPCSSCTGCSIPARTGPSTPSSTPCRTSGRTSSKAPDTTRGSSSPPRCARS